MAKPSDRRNLSYSEKSIIKVAGDSSKKWHINDLHKAVVEKCFNSFRGSPKQFANFLRRRPHFFDFQNDELATKFNSEEIRNMESDKVLKHLEISLLKVAGNSSQTWNINDFHQVLVQKGVNQFGDDPKNLTNFIHGRPHLFDFENDKLSTKFNNEEIRKLSDQRNEHIFQSMSDLEVAMVRVAGNDSQKWSYNQFRKALRENDIADFTVKELQDFVKVRPHIFEYKGHFTTTFDSLNGLPTSRNLNITTELQQMSKKRKLEVNDHMQANDHLHCAQEIVRLNETICNLKEENLKLREEILELKSVHLRSKSVPF